MTSATVLRTFLFTDVERSTELATDLGPTYAELLTRHRELLRGHVKAGGGSIFGVEGDAVFAVFLVARSAVIAAVAMQLSLAEEHWASIPFRVRMGIHTGLVSIDTGEFIGIALHKVARIAAAAHGGQILLSAETWHEVSDAPPADVTADVLGAFRLKGFDGVSTILQLVAPGIARTFPAPRLDSSHRPPYEPVASEASPYKLTIDSPRGWAIGSTNDIRADEEWLSQPVGRGFDRRGPISDVHEYPLRGHIQPAVLGGSVHIAIHTNDWYPQGGASIHDTGRFVASVFLHDSFPAGVLWFQLRDRDGRPVWETSLTFS